MKRKIQKIDFATGANSFILILLLITAMSGYIMVAAK